MDSSSTLLLTHTLYIGPVSITHPQIFPNPFFLDYFGLGLLILATKNLNTYMSLEGQLSKCLRGIVELMSWQLSSALEPQANFLCPRVRSNTWQLFMRLGSSLPESSGAQSGPLSAPKDLRVWRHYGVPCGGHVEIKLVR